MKKVQKENIWDKFPIIGHINRFIIVVRTNILRYLFFNCNKLKMNIPHLAINDNWKLILLIACGKKIKIIIADKLIFSW
ncbi:MAG: hypothetical protein ACRCW6_01305 [Mycoplasmoidaceae bacterium]